MAAVTNVLKLYEYWITNEGDLKVGSCLVVKSSEELYEVKSNMTTAERTAPVCYPWAFIPKEILDCAYTIYASDVMQYVSAQERLHIPVVESEPVSNILACYFSFRPHTGKIYEALREVAFMHLNTKCEAILADLASLKRVTAKLELANAEQTTLF